MKVYAGSITHRAYEHNFVQSLALLLKRYPGVAVQLLAGDALVERQRSIMATHFLLETEADVLLTIDSDIDFDPDDAIKICEQAMEYDIVCAAYAGRKMGYPKPLMDMWPDTSVTFADDPTPVPIKYGASGFMAIHRRVFEALAKRDDMPLCYPNKPMRFYPFYKTKVIEEPDFGPIVLSEDYALCAYAREEGFETHLNPAVRLGHQGSYIYRLEDMTVKPVASAPVRVQREGNTYSSGIGTPVKEAELQPVS